MSLDSKQLARIAMLSRLRLEPGQSDQLQKQLNNIMSLADTLGQQDTSGVEPLSHPLALISEVALRLREDVVTEPDNREANMANAPSRQEGLFLVPKVID